MYCKKCNCLNKEGDSFCLSCGSSLEKKSNSGRLVKGIIIGIMSLIIVVLIVIAVIFVLPSNNNQPSIPVAAKYDCKGIDDASGNITDEYYISLELNNDMTFLYGPYGNLKNNHVSGTYEYVKENKETNVDADYYELTLTGNKDDFLVDGVNQNRQFISKIEMTFLKEKTSPKKEAMIILYSNYDMYYCYER